MSEMQDRWKCIDIKIKSFCILFNPSVQIEIRNPYSDGSRIDYLLEHQHVSFIVTSFLRVQKVKHNWWRPFPNLSFCSESYVQIKISNPYSHCPWIDFLLEYQMINLKSVILIDEGLEQLSTRIKNTIMQRILHTRYSTYTHAKFIVIMLYH